MSAIRVDIQNFSIDLLQGGNKIYKTLLHPVNVVIDSGTLFAILGGSGSGKTSLLNVIAGRYDKNSFKIGGKIVFGDSYYGNTGYVTQLDFLLPFLTVKETIMFAAKLKIAYQSNVVIQNRGNSIDAIVNEVILDLGLKECSDTRIGDDSQVFGARGISGGEKRRVSIACQIITNPQLLCADEPTSGLDSFTAITVVESLRRIASSRAEGRHCATVICSVHQPRADVFNLFDSILLLSRGGHPVYCGPVANMRMYFEKLGYNCPTNSNPADFYVDISSIDSRSRDTERDDAKRVHFLATTFQKENHTLPSPLIMSLESPHIKGHDMATMMDDNLGVTDTLKTSRYECPWTRQVSLLTLRFLLNNLRSRANMMGGILQALLMGIIIMLIFFRLSNSLADIQSRNGLIYLSISMECYILLIILVERYCTELKVFDRELQDNMYTSSAYLVAHIISSIPILVLMPAIYSVPIYFGCNLRHGAGHFLVFVAVQISMSFITNGLAWASVSLNRSFTVASLIANTNFTFITIVSGFLVVTSDIPVYIRWVKHISYIQYAYRILMSNEFTNRVFPGCPSPDEANCSQYIGNDILSTQAVDENEYKSYTWLFLFGLWAAYYAVTFVCLHYIRFPVTGVAGVEINIEEAFSDSRFPESEFNEEDVDNLRPMVANTPSVAALLDTYQECIPVAISVRHVTLCAPNVKGSSDFQQYSSEMSNEIDKELDGMKTRLIKNTAVQQCKCILHDVSAEILPGRLVALMGGSGSGKTTLLNLIAGHAATGCVNNAPSSKPCESKDGQYIGHGEVLFNGSACESRTLQSLVAYVQQFDFHYPLLTVMETFQFHASLRFRKNSDKFSKKKKINRLIRLLGLAQCENTRVGGEGTKGISGGECRRLSIGIQLLKDPSICVLDEPTTGLDSFTARHIVETLQDLAHKGRRTVLLSIHQPRYDIFGLIDDVVLLSRGMQIWSGPTSGMLAHFASLGFPFPGFSNPADFILDITSLDFRSDSKEVKSRAALDKLATSYYSLAASKVSAGDVETGRRTLQDINTLPTATTSENGLIDSLGLLLHRSYLNMTRQPILATTRISQGLFFALILAAFYAPMRDNQNSIQNRIGLLYELTALCFIGMLSCIAIFPIERNVFYREYVDGSYSFLAFFLSYFIIAIPVIAFAAFLISLLVVFAIGLQPTWTALGIFTFVLSCFMFAGECIGVIFCAMFMHVGFSVNVMSIFIGITNQFTGFVSLSIPMWLDYLGYFSPAKWGSVILTNVVFRGEAFSCDKSEELVTGDCPLSTGQQVLNLYNMDYSDELYRSQFFCLMILSTVTLLLFACAFSTFRMKAYKLSH